MKSSLGTGEEQRQVEWVRPWRVAKEEDGWVEEGGRVLSLVAVVC